MAAYSYQVCNLKPIQTILFRGDDEERDMVSMSEFYDIRVMFDSMNGIKAKLLNPERLDCDKILESTDLTELERGNLLRAFGFQSGGR